MASALSEEEQNLARYAEEFQGRNAAPAKYIAEFLGTFLLVFVIGCNVVTGNAAWSGTSIACALMVSIYALGGVSGAHFNPAVSLALALSRRLSWKDFGIYCGVQVAGGILASFAYSAWGVFQLEPAGTARGWEACLVEFLFTCMLCFVVLNVAVSMAIGGKNQFYGLAIGFVIVAGGYAAGGISGACFNPAVAISIDVSSYHLGIFWCMPYTVCEMLGACLAALLFRICRPEEHDPNEKPGDYLLPERMLAEFVGCFYLVLTVVLNVLGGSLAPVWSIAASLMCMIFALGDQCGAHFNPAVTVAVLCAGKRHQHYNTPKDAGAYIAAQVLGGIAGSFTGASLLKFNTVPLRPGHDFGWSQVVAAELSFTFLLCFVVLSVATVKKSKGLTEFFGLAIGSCVTVGGLAIGSISGGSLNPAVSIGLASADLLNGGRFWECIAYTVIELAGAGLAAAVFMGTRPSEFAKGVEQLPLSVE